MLLRGLALLCGACGGIRRHVAQNIPHLTAPNMSNSAAWAAFKLDSSRWASAPPQIVSQKQAAPRYRILSA